MHLRRPLPIDSYVPQIVASLESGQNLLLKASPGSGKTTRAPAALLAADFVRGAEILVLEPRRLAAKMAATFVATELGGKVGDLVGYQFRFENRTGPATRLKFLTEGTFLRRLVSDPTLKGVAAVVLDEFHERSLQTDLAVSALRTLQKSKRPDLRILVISATLEAEKLATYLEAKVLEVTAPIYPVEVEYLLEKSTKFLEVLVRSALEKIVARYLQGDILVFLPGQREIRRCEEELAAFARSRQIDVRALYGDLSREEQDAVVLPGPRRKVILSTNIAESSVTIENLVAVVDSGLHRQAAFSWWSGIPSLSTKSISRASAIQRTGRAGRLGPGFCQRLYTKADFDGRAAFEKPEIERAELSQALLELHSSGLLGEKNFTWFAEPPAKAAAAALELLEELGSLHEGAITALGRRMADFPLHPRLSHFLIQAEAAGLSHEALEVVLYLSEGNFNDLNLFDDLENYRPSKTSERLKAQLERLIKFSSRATTVPQSRAALSRLILKSFPDRVGILRADSKTEILLAPGGSARIAEGSLTGESRCFVLLEVGETQSARQTKPELRPRSLVPIEEDWLLDIEKPGLREERVAYFDSNRSKVLAKERLMYGALTLSETVVPLKATDRGFEVFLSAALSVNRTELQSMVAFIHRLKTFMEVEKFEEMLCRLQLLSEAFASDFQRDFSLTELFNVLAEILDENLSIENFRSLLWVDSLALYFLKAESLAYLDRRLPTALTMPNGRKARIHYEFDKEPWLGSRLQDFFGLPDAPKILEGRLALTLHLLAPNQRPVQVTRDLKGFWQRVYQELRPQLSRRYPRHQWPEDPLTKIKD